MSKVLEVVKEERAAKQAERAEAGAKAILNDMIFDVEKALRRVGVAQKMLAKYQARLDKFAALADESHVKCIEAYDDGETSE